MEDEDFFGPTDEELDELEAEAPDFMVEDGSYRSREDKHEEIMERLDAIEELLQKIQPK